MLTNQKVNSGPNFELWSEEQLHELHLASLKILENTGVVVHDAEALKLLKDAGAFVEENVAKIPAHMVEDAIKSAPSRVTITGLDEKKQLNLYRNNVYYGLGTDLPSFTDPYTGKIRETVLDDVINVGKVTQACDNIDFIASLGLASDVDQRMVDLYHLKSVRMHCDKPNWTTAVDADSLKALIDMSAVSAGGYEELRRNPTFGVYNEPISPLVYSEEAVQKLMMCAEYGIPSTWASGIIAGATGPVTLAGCLALGNAEGLGGLVIHQLKRKGSPFILGIVMSIMDMMTTVSSYASPEFIMAHAIVGQLGRFYDIPTYGTGGCSDSNVLDAQAGMEAAFTNFTAALGGTNLTHDNGYLGAGLIGSLSMIMLDDEVNGYIKRFMRSVEINSDTLALDLIHEVGHGGEFVSKTHTFQNFRKELYMPKHANRKQYQSWRMDGSKPIDKVIDERVIEIIESVKEPLLSAHEIQMYDEIIGEREAKIKVEGLSYV